MTPNAIRELQDSLNKVAGQAGYQGKVLVLPEGSKVSPSSQTPSIGRIVHYVSYGTPVLPDGSQAFTTECRAAVITEVPDIGGPYVNGEDVPNELVGLCVLNPQGMFFNEAEHSEDDKPGGTWHWPERV